jgi:FixJ family two-component response regulator
VLILPSICGRLGFGTCSKQAMATRRWPCSGHIRPSRWLISDVRMPGAIDGVALAGWLRAHRPDVKVVLVSGHLPSVQPGTADLLVEKPIQPQNLITRIEHMLTGS